MASERNNLFYSLALIIPVINLLIFNQMKNEMNNSRVYDFICLNNMRRAF